MTATKTILYGAIGMIIGHLIFMAAGYERNSLEWVANGLVMGLLSWKLRWLP